MNAVHLLICPSRFPSYIYTKLNRLYVHYITVTIYFPLTAIRASFHQMKKTLKNLERTPPRTRAALFLQTPPDNVCPLCSYIE